MTDQPRLWEIEVGFRRPLRTVRGVVPTRRSVIVAVDRDGATGWAEAPAFPSGRFGTSSDAFEALTDPSRWENGLPIVPIASAALQAARADAAARAVGVPLHSHLGASAAPVAARHPIGLLSTEDVEHEAAWLDAHGVTAVKVKIAPGHDTEPIAALRSLLPDLDIGLDANASYADPDDPSLAVLDMMETSFIEQPFPASELAAHAVLRQRLRTPVCLDESVPDVASIRRALAAAAADQIAVKLNRVGLRALRTALQLCGDAGVGVQLGGTFDTSIGRRHLLAAAGLSGIVDAAVGPPAAYLANDVGPYPEITGGMVEPFRAPGIGPPPDPTQLDSIALRSA